MFSGYSSYKAEIKNLKFITEEGIVHPKTAIVHFTFPGKAQPVVEILGYEEQEEIFNMIDEDKPVNLDYCYIPELSASKYRQSRNIERKKLLKIRDFTARHSVFDPHSSIDLSYLSFIGDVFSLEGSLLTKGSVSFNSSDYETKHVNFSNAVFYSGDFSFSNVKIGNAELSFKNSIFGKGKKDFQYTDFGLGEKLFANTEFNEGEVSFINTHFNDGNVSFKIARFGRGKVDFHFAKFGKGDISFERTEFGDGGVDFRTVEFGYGRVNFNRSVFGRGEISFEGCEKYEGKFGFKRAIFGAGNLNFELAEMQNTDLSFEKTEFGDGNISFHQGKFGNLSLKSCHLDHYTDLRLAACHCLDLSNTIVRDIIDLKPYEFDQQIELIRFSGMRLIGRLYIDWNKNNVYHLIKKQKDSGNRQKAEQFRILKENFSICGQYNDEDKAYLQFKRHEARAELKEITGRNKWNGLWVYPFHLFKLLVFDKAGHYATNPARVILSMLFSYTMFSLLYYILILSGLGDIVESVTHDGTINDIGRAFYHSAITFLTIGYGDYYPSGAIRWISGIEGFTGVFLMSYFTVAFVRKVLR